jgi:hypothetical protein
MEKGDLFSKKLIISTIPDSIVQSISLPLQNSISSYKKSSQCTGLGIGTLLNHSPIVLDYFLKVTRRNNFTLIRNDSS